MATTVSYSNNVDRIFDNVQSVIDDLTLTAADSGKTLFLNAAGGGTVILPALKAGLNFKVIIGATAPTTAWIVDSAEGDNISGVLNVNGALVAAVAEDQINFIASTAVTGDTIELDCDGTNWYLKGLGSAAGSITVTDPA